MSSGGRSTYLRSGLTALVVVLVVGVLMNYFLLKPRAPGVLDGQVVSQRISQAIQFNTRTPLKGSIDCPAQEPQRAGLQFTCTLVAGSRRTPVTVHETDGHGDFTFHVAQASPAGSPGGS